ncbi:acyl transferase 15-like [Triticum dicoccoides]|uniref:acyl transferase 15-like n=1 Tax=Triticum dicoccoides TaxID=85692 RepID=UPI00162EBA69|nr:acyl transferase 15-like [Triticum dicoccoides]
MSFAVSKSAPVMVRPSTEPVLGPGKTRETQVVQLSSWDTTYVDFQVTVLLVFDGSVHQPMEAIKKGLSRALAHYYTIAGRLTATADEEGVLLHVACTGEGVPFVAASAGCALQDHGLLDAPFTTSLLDDLAVYYPAPEGCRSTDPMLLMQVTEFACGGFTLGVTWNHTLADATGIAQFLQAVGELTRAEVDASAVPSVTPVRDGRAASLPLLSPSVVAAKQSLMLDLAGQGLSYLDIIVPLKLINRIKSDYKAAHSSEARYCTTFEATAAVLWRCRTRAIIGDDPDGYDMSTPAPLAFFVNVRKHVGTAAGYYGNCAVAQLAFATTGEVAGAVDEGMNGLVDLIKRAKDGVPELLRGMTAGGGAVDGMGEEEIAAAFGYNALMVTSWGNIRFDHTDFGGGAPARVVGRWQQSTLPACMASLSCRATAADGERLLTQCVRAEHAAALLAELDQLAHASCA